MVLRLIMSRFKREKRDASAVATNDETDTCVATCKPTRYDTTTKQRKGKEMKRNAEGAGYERAQQKQTKRRENDNNSHEDKTRRREEPKEEKKTCCIAIKLFNESFIKIEKFVVWKPEAERSRGPPTPGKIRKNY